MPVSSFESGTPVEFSQGTPISAEKGEGQHQDEYNTKVKDYVINWRNQLKQQRLDKLSIWNECWALFRGQDNFDNKEDWQSKIVLPKAFGTVKQAVSVIKRFLNTAKKPWNLDAINQNDPLEVLKAEKMSNLSHMFLTKAHFVEEFSTGLETGFIMGLGVWKIGWNLVPRIRMRIQEVPVPYGPPPPGALVEGLPQQPAASSQGLPVGQSRSQLIQQQGQQYPTQMGQEHLLPQGSFNQPGPPPTGNIMAPGKQVIKEEIMEGQLYIKAVDPYNFYWLPGSKLNRWTGTIEEIEVNKWELMKMAKQGVFDPEMVKNIKPMKIDEVTMQSFLRFGELNRIWSGPNVDAGIVKITEFYGPLIIDGELTEEHAHVMIANDTYIIRNEKISAWMNKPPYCGFSPLQLPFRTEGMGLVEMVRSIDKALNQIINLGVDTLVFRLLPVFEFTPDVYENAEDIKTGLTPGKILRRSGMINNGDLGLRPIEFQDVSPGAMQVAGALDRAHQEGGLVSELQQSMPRWSGAQTATETEAIQTNQQSFFGAMASDIEQFAIAPIIQMCIDNIMQYIDTANDPRVAAVLGMDAIYLQGMSQPEIMEMITGDYEVQVKGLTGQLEKAEMLQNLVQLMNLIGQNPEAWLPWIKQDELLRRVFESFRPTIHDVEKILNDPQTAAAAQASMQASKQQESMMNMIPALVKMAHDNAQQQVENKQMDINNDNTHVDQAIRLKEIAVHEAALKAPKKD